MDTERARIAEDMLSFAMLAPKARNLAELQDMMTSRTEQWGITHFAACIMMDSEGRFRPGPMFGKVNVAWGAAYFEHDLYRYDPVIAYALGGGGGAYWGDAFDPARISKGGRRVLEMAAGCGASDGYLMPVDVRGGDKMVVSYQGLRLEHDPKIQAALETIGGIYARAGQRLLDGAQPNSAKVASLTQHQVRILKMSGAGMTNAQVAENLDVAVKTIEYHLAKARLVLGVTNTKEAIAALLEGSRKPDAGIRKRRD